MVGHTGNIEAAIKALESIDKCVKRVVDAINDVGGVLLITADHGNCEQMIDYETGEPHTAHTTNPVPLAMIGTNKKLKEGRLADLMPTMLDIMGLEKPEEMTGESLLTD
jgi:2,3-bisphosphoglycerate-independent phosphoglycerate mutase